MKLARSIAPSVRWSEPVMPCAGHGSSLQVELRTCSILLQRAEVGDDILNLVVGELAGEGLHLALAVLDGLFLLLGAVLVLRSGLDAHHLGHSGVRRAGRAVAALAVRLVSRFARLGETHSAG